VICPCLAYLEMQPAMDELADTVGIDVERVSDDDAEIRWESALSWPSGTNPSRPTAATSDLRPGRVPRGPLRAGVNGPETGHIRQLTETSGVQRLRSREGTFWPSRSIDSVTRTTEPFCGS
jgi:hypothetical protein